jgi:hypothetical protein
MAVEGMNILFLTHPYPNYVPDLLLHGLRKLLGPKVVEYPRKDCLYNGVLGLGICPDELLCPNWFPEDNGQVDREDIWQKVTRGHFRYVFCDVRGIPLLQNNLAQWPKGMVIIDGEDHPLKIAPGPYVVLRRETEGLDPSIPLPMSIPEEIFNWITSFDNLPKTYSVGFLGSVGGFYEERREIVERIARQFPDSLMKVSNVPSEIDRSPTGRTGRDEYYRNLQRCKVVLTLRGAGFDTFRFWENAACRAVHISQRMPLLIPNDFESDKQILRFSNLDELMRHIEFALDDKNDARLNQVIRDARFNLLRFHMTTRRAEYILDRLIRIFY